MYHRHAQLRQYPRDLVLLHLYSQWSLPERPIGLQAPTRHCAEAVTPPGTLLKTYVDGATVKRLAEAVRAGDMAQVRAILKARPELVHMDMADNNEHRALHCAVLDWAPEMVRLSQRRAKAKRIFQSLGTSLCIGYV